MSDPIEVFPLCLPNSKAKAQTLNCGVGGGHAHVKMPVFVKDMVSFDVNLFASE